GVGDCGAIVAADDVQAQVDSGGKPGGCQNGAVLDIEDVGTYIDLRVPVAQFGGVQPVRRRGTAVQESGLSQYERPGADGGDALAVRGGMADRFQHQGIGAVTCPGPRDDHGVGV